MIQLSEQYTTLGALDYWKDMKTNMERKDGAYNFVYCHNAIGIIETRKTYIGRLVSNWVEMKKPKLKQYRIEAEKYINLHMDSYVVRPDQRSGPKIEILIE
jgi:acyl-ACP thioesterase